MLFRSQKAISSPLLEDVSVDGAMGILVNVTGGPSLTLHEVNAAIELITDAAHEDANIIFGYVVDHERDEEVSITVIATGFEHSRSQKRNEPTFTTTVPAQQPMTPYPLQGSRDIPTFIRQGLSSRETVMPGVSSYPNLGTKVPPATNQVARVPVLAPIDEHNNGGPLKDAAPKKMDEYDIPGSSTWKMTTLAPLGQPSFSA
mgnify:CR=1 FL=1